MLEHLKTAHVLYIDIETVPQEPDYTKLDTRLQQAWESRMAWAKDDDQSFADQYADRAGIYAEFGKIICISAGYVIEEEGKEQLRIRSWSGDDEKSILNDFAELLNSYYPDPSRHLLCGHNIKEFDVPYLCRRMLVHGLKLPAVLDLQGLKPWEVPHVDTMHLWKFGDRKAYTSLDLLAALFEIPSSKSDMSGDMVADVYYKEQDLDRIVKYCQQDVVVVCQLLRKFQGLDLITEGQVKIS